MAEQRRRADSPAAGRTDGRAGRPAGPVTNPEQEAVLDLQRQAGNRAVVQRFREYGEIKGAQPFTFASGSPGKLVPIATDFHVTISEAPSLPAHFDDFHVTYEKGPVSARPHFYFNDQGYYQATGEGSQKNKNFKAGPNGKTEWPKKLEQAKALATTFVDQHAPAYEGATPAAVDAAHKKKQDDAAAAAKEAAEDAAKQAAGVKRLVASVGKSGAKNPDLVKFASWLESTLGGQASGGKVVAKHTMEMTVTFADFAAAKSASLLLAAKRYNDKLVSAELPAA
jgi:hypothetical protein